MSRGIIKIGAGDEDWNSGALLEHDERFQSDAEWHASLLEEIIELQRGHADILAKINDDIETVAEYVQRNPQPFIIEKHVSNSTPMSTWRFIVAWLISIPTILAIVNIIWA